MSEAEHLDQLDERVQRAILGNVGTLITFRVGVRNVKVLVDEFFPEFAIEDLVSLPAYEIYLRLTVDGVVTRGFSGETVPPHQVRPASPES